MATSLPSGATAVVHAPDTFDAGLHTDTDAGPVEVGLAVEPGAIGVVVEAPGIGRLRAAFEVAADGSTRLSTLSRVQPDGAEARVAPLVVIDEARTLELEGQLKRVNQRLAETETERDEARDRAAVLNDEKKSLLKGRGELEFAIAQHKSRLDALTADLELARLGRLEALGHREALQTELEGLRAQQSDQVAAARAATAEAEQKLAAQTQSMALLEVQSGQLRSRAEAAEGGLTAARAELAELPPLRQRVASQEADLKKERDAVALLSTEGSSVADALKTQLTQANTALEEAQAQTAALREELAATLKKANEAGSDTQLRKAELEAAHAQLDAAKAQVDALNSELEGVKAGLETAHRTIADAEARAGAGSTEAAARQAAEASLTALQADLAAKEANLTALQADLTGKEASWAEAVAQRDSTIAEHLAWAEQAQLTNAGLTTQLETETAATGEARDIARTLQATNARLLAERDEARNVARSLHQQVGKTSEVDTLHADLSKARAALEAERAEKDRLLQRVDSTSRQLETERSARAKVVAERDQLKDQFRAVASGESKDNTLGPNFGRESTMPYSLDSLRPTNPENPTVKVKTNPAIPRVPAPSAPQSPKKKG